MLLVLKGAFMPAKKDPITDAERSRRFIEKAKEIGADESTEGFEQVFEKMLPPKRARQKRQTATPKKRQP